MYMQVDVSDKDMRFSFAGTLPGKPLKMGDVQAWMSALHTLADAAKEQFRKNRE